MQPTASSPRRWSLAVFAAALALYLPTVTFDFTGDDRAIIEFNPLVQTPPLFPLLWTRGYWGDVAGATMGHFRPVTTSTYALTWWLAGNAPWLFHAGNALLHALVCLVLFSLLRRWGVAERAVGIAALTFAVHPLHIEAVAGVVGRAELLSALLGLLAWRVHLGAERSPSQVAAAAGLYLAALLSKEAAVPLLGLFIAGDWVRSGNTRDWWRRRLPLWAAEAGALVVFLIARRLAVGVWGGGTEEVMPFNPLAEAPFATRIRTALVVLGLHWRLFAWPWPLVPDYSLASIHLAESWLDPRLLASIVLLTALVALAWATRRRDPAVALAVLIYLFAVSIVSNIVFLVGVLLAERTLYLPSVGMCLLAGIGADALIRRRSAAMWALALLGIALAGVTLVQSRVWRDDPALFRHAVAHQPNSTMAWASWAAVLLDDDDRGRDARATAEEALAAANRSLAIWPPNQRALLQRARAAAVLGSAEESVRDLDRILALDPANGDALRLRLNAAREWDELGLVEPLIQAALAEDPNCVVALEALGRWRLDEGRIAEGLEAGERLVGLVPFSRAGWLIILEAKQGLGDSEGARAAARELERWTRAAAEAGRL